MNPNQPPHPRDSKIHAMFFKVKIWLFCQINKSTKTKNSSEHMIQKSFFILKFASTLHNIFRQPITQLNIMHHIDQYS